MNNAQLHGCEFEGWQCFHCGEVFTTVGSAEDHFGGQQGALTGCQIKAGDERGLLMALRQVQNKIAELEAAILEYRAFRWKPDARGWCLPYGEEEKKLFAVIQEQEK